MLSILSLTPSIAASYVPPCLIATVRVSSKFGALRERFYRERIWLQVLKTFREENEDVRELRRARRLSIDPKDSYVAASMQQPEVQSWLNQSWGRRRVFMVCGILIARPTGNSKVNISTESSSEISV
jgi:hypothetical protein